MSIDKEEGRALALREANAGFTNQARDTVVIVDEDTITTPYGWIFFYDSQRRRETGSSLFALGGNGPIVVEADSGRVTSLGSLRPPEEEIAEFERKRGLPPSHGATP